MALCPLQLLVGLFSQHSASSVAEPASEPFQPTIRISWSRNAGVNRPVNSPMHTRSCHILPRQSLKEGMGTLRDLRFLPRVSHDVYTTSHACKRTGLRIGDIVSAIVLSVVTSHSLPVMKLPCFWMWISVGGLKKQYLPTQSIYLLTDIFLGFILLT